MGVFISIIIIVLWLFNLMYSLNYVNINLTSFSIYFHFFIQIFLFTGLFITGHDAMHNAISSNRTINKVIGYISSFLFAGLSYKKLVNNHRKHHAFVGSENDPDYSIKHQNPFLWFAIFMYRYLSFTQIIIMAIIFNLLKIKFTEISIWSFWVVPAILSTFQLFYFGTYKPHKLPHTEEMQPYNSRTQRKNHLLAFISCYFFGYHYEHHYKPDKPWWKLYQVKEELINKGVL